METILIILNFFTGLIVFSAAGWAALEFIRTKRAERHKAEAIARMLTEAGRQLASGTATAERVDLDDCKDPGCPIHGRR